MKSNLRLAILVLVILALGVYLPSSCTPGTAPTPIPGNVGVQDPGTGGGDPREPQYYGVGQLLPETLAYGDLVDVAVNEDFIYVLDETTVYAFTKSGILVNTVVIPVPPAKGLAILPTIPTEPDPNMTPYLFAKHVAVSYTPGPGGIAGNAVSIYGPHLDDTARWEDETEPNLIKRFDLPRYFHNPDQGMPAELCIPNVQAPGDVTPRWEITNTGDLIVNRDGAILQKANIHPYQGTPRVVSDAMIIYHPEIGPAGFHMYFPPNHDVPAGEDDPFAAEGEMIATPYYAIEFGDQTGGGTKFAFSSQYPNSRRDTINFYCGDYTLTRDFVGVGSFLSDDTVSPVRYAISSTVGNAFGWSRIIGESYGSAPGSFAFLGPINPIDGTPEDPDITQGGPAGIGVDPRNDDVFICDPGNRRVQVFDKDGNFLRQIGDGTRGTSGNALIAPSSVTVDLDGTVYICDTNILRVFRVAEQELQFGNLAGTIRNPKAPTPLVLVDATVTISSLSGGVVTTALTDINGQYGVDNLLIGDYFVTANKFQYQSDSANVRILPDETVIANFNLYPEIGAPPGHITGTVIDDVTNLPLSGAKVSVVGTSLETLTEPTGFFTINDVEAGEWQIRFDLELYNTVLYEVYVVSGQTAQMGVIKLMPLLAGS
ncbi:carboxypeptidase regulatory-like domain-containing protein [bacterium]|nr:carboxypeptidase regulatory-like domain-containing protein [bacterium]